MKIVLYTLIVLLLISMFAEWFQFNHYATLNKQLEADVTAYEKFMDSSKHVVAQEIRTLRLEDSIAEVKNEAFRLHNQIIKGK